MSTFDPTIYDRSFFEGIVDESLESAKQIVPLIIDWVRPQSVIDVGCGVGTWLSVFREYGVTDIAGIDGDYVHRDMLLIPLPAFSACDLRNPKPLSRRFDFVMSLETAEHLPEESAAPFVKFLTSLGDVVLFSAAIPGQARTPGVHLNEQWQDYWVELFRQNGFAVIDAFRGRVWNNERVCWWYAQNALLFVSQEQFPKYVALQRTDLENRRRSTPLSVVHPRLFRQYAHFDTMSVVQRVWLLRRLLRSLGKDTVRRVLFLSPKPESKIVEKPKCMA
jgi:SAM-dependent methyltransferase